MDDKNRGIAVLGRWARFGSMAGLGGWWDWEDGRNSRKAVLEGWQDQEDGRSGMVAVAVTQGRNGHGEGCACSMWMFHVDAPRCHPGVTSLWMGMC